MQSPRSTESSAASETPRSRVLRFRDENGQNNWGSNPADLDMPSLARTLRHLAPLFAPESGLYPATVEGWQNLPEPGALFISNHSGGTVIPDVWGLMAAWYRHHGLTRPLHGLAHEMIFATEATARFFARRGILRATRTMAHTILRKHKRDLLVLPGGDLDTWRPFTQRWSVDFHGRQGYAKVAIENQVPIVPIAHGGAHHTLIVLDDGRKIAELLRLPELFRAHIFPVHLSIPYGLGVGPLPHIPPPTALRYRIGRPVMPPKLQPGESPTPTQVAALDQAVRNALQAELNVLRADSDAMLDRVEHTIHKFRGHIQHLRGRDLHPTEWMRFVREQRSRTSGAAAVVGLAAK